MDIDIVGELKVLSQDIGYLAKIYKRDLEERASILRMLAAKWEHVAHLFRCQAEDLEQEKAVR